MPLPGETITLLEAGGYTGLLFFFTLFTHAKATEKPSEAPSNTPSGETAVAHASRVGGAAGSGGRHQKGGCCQDEESDEFTPLTRLRGPTAA